MMEKQPAKTTMSLETSFWLSISRKKWILKEGELWGLAHDSTQWSILPRANQATAAGITVVINGREAKIIDRW